MKKSTKHIRSGIADYILTTHVARTNASLTLLAAMGSDRAGCSHSVSIWVHHIRSVFRFIERIRNDYRIPIPRHT